MIAHHDTPSYPRDPGDGVELERDGDEVQVRMFFDGACRYEFTFPLADVLAELLPAE